MDAEIPRTISDIIDTYQDLSDLEENFFKDTGRPMDPVVAAKILNAKITLAKALGILERVDNFFGISEQFIRGRMDALDSIRDARDHLKEEE